MPEYARPPRGWLKGVFLTIMVSWLCAKAWDGFQTGEHPITLAGAGISIVAGGIVAYEAYTNESYRTSRATYVGTLVGLVGLIVLGVAKVITGQ
jgi:hypothetical protein